MEVKDSLMIMINFALMLIALLTLINLSVHKEKDSTPRQEIVLIFIEAH
ncbi:putative holin-like toxin [Paenibacillus chitinolyticus]